MANSSKPSRRALDKLHGSIPPLITPFSRGEVDYDAYAKLVTLQIEHEIGVPSGTRAAMIGEQMQAVRKQFVDAVG